MNDFGTILGAHTLRFERLLPCSLEGAWNYLTDPAFLGTWLAKGVVEQRAGGKVELHFDVEEIPERKREGAVVHGLVKRCEPQKMLAYSWGSCATASDSDSVVTFELRPEGDDVRLTLTHEGLASSILARCGAGWHTHLDILTARIAAQRPQAFLETWRRLVPEYEHAAERFVGAAANGSN